MSAFFTLYWKEISLAIIGIINAVFAIRSRKKTDKVEKNAETQAKLYEERLQNWQNAETLRKELDGRYEELLEQFKNTQGSMKIKDDEIAEWREKYFKIQLELQKVFLDYKRMSYDYGEIVKIFNKTNGELVAYLRALHAECIEKPEID